MYFISYVKEGAQLYRLLLKDYYTQEAPYRFLDVISHFFPSTTPLCQRITEAIKGKEFEILSEETLKEENWAQLKELVERVKKLFNIKEEIILAKDLLGKFPDYAILGNIIIANEKKAFSLTKDAQKFAIAHELSHYIHHHLDQRIYMNSIWIVIDFSCLALVYYKSPLYFLALGIAEIAIFHIDRAICRYHEKEADLTAIENLKSNKGAKEAFILDLIFDGIDFLKATHYQLSSNLSNEDVSKQLLLIGYKIHASFIAKIALTHPTHEIRLQYCGLGENSNPR